MAIDSNLTVYQYTQRENKLTSLQILINKAELEEWNEILIAVKNNPSLINTADETGKTILWIAASKNSYDSIIFILDLVNNNYKLNWDAAPLGGEDEGKTAAWELFEFNPYSVTIKKREILSKIVEDYDFNINAAPKKGPKQGCTIFYLMASYSEAWGPVTKPWLKKNTQEIFLSSFNNLGIENNPLFLLALWYFRHEIYKSEDDPILKTKTYENIFKIIEKNPEYIGTEVMRREKRMDKENKQNCPDFKPRTILEFAFSFSPCPERDKLILYLIVAGGKISDSAEAQWKEEYVNIKKQVDSLFEKVRTFYLCDINSQFPLIKELRQKISYTMISEAFPALTSFPWEFLRKRFFLHKV